MGRDGESSMRPAGEKASAPARARAVELAGAREPASVKTRRSALTLAVPVALFAALLAIALARSLALTNGRLVYTLDDAYIHMAMAKHFASHGVWGVTPYEFSATSSSPLWTLLLAGIYAISGPSELVPVALNIVAALLLLWAAFRLLAPRAAGAQAVSDSRSTLPLIALLAIVLFTPLVPLVMSGQEHTLHLLAVVLFATAVARRWTDDSRTHGGTDGGTDVGRARGLRAAVAVWRPALAFWVLPFVLVAIRYESLFLLLPVCLAFAWRRRYREAVLIGAIGMAPVILLGIVQTSNGASFLPNPLLRKAGLPFDDPARLASTLTGYRALRRLFVNPHLLAPALAALVWLARRPEPSSASQSPALVSRESPGRMLLFVFLVALLLHLSFAELGWFYRYEAYLVAFGIVALALAVADVESRAPGPGNLATLRAIKHRAPAVVLALLTLVAMGDRGVRAWIDAPRASANIFEQQYQMGLFLRERYAGAAVALNDIGAANFLADLRCIDVYGLADREVLSALRSKRYDVSAVDRIVRARKGRMAILYPNWIRIPSSWERVGHWQIERNVVNGGDLVAFYAIDPAEAPALARNLRDFAPRLPGTVRQGGAYLDAS